MHTLEYIVSQQHQQQQDTIGISNSISLALYIGHISEQGILHTDKYYMKNIEIQIFEICFD